MTLLQCNCCYRNVKRVSYLCRVSFCYVVHQKPLEGCDVQRNAFLCRLAALTGHLTLAAPTDVAEAHARMPSCAGGKRLAAGKAHTVLVGTCLEAAALCLLFVALPSTLPLASMGPK